MISHFAVCRANNDATTWLSIYGDASGWHVGSSSASLKSHIDGLIDAVKKHPLADVTFTTRQAVDFLAQPLPATSDSLREFLPGASIMVLAPVGGVADDDMWGRLWRDPRGGLSTPGRSSFFRAATLGDAVQSYFAFGQGLKEFEKPGFPRELWVRRSWSAAAILPEQFPPPRPLPTPAPELTEQRRARGAKARRQEKQRANERGEVRHGFDQSTGRHYDATKQRWNKDIGGWERKPGYKP
jgi:hypothetical protein